MADGIGCSLGSLAKQCFEFGKDLLDGVEVGAVFWQEKKLGSGGANGGAHGFALMTAEIVEDDDVTGFECRHQHLLDVSPEGLAIDWPVDDAGRIDAIRAQGGEEGDGSPSPLRHLAQEPATARCPAAERCHVGFGPGLVDEDEPRRVKSPLVSFPAPASLCHVGPVLFDCEQSFF